MKINLFKLKSDKIVYAFIGIVTLFISYVRMIFGASIAPGDECYNIGIAYRAVLGQLPLSEIWEFHQTGDLFAYPFIKLFCMLRGNTEGLILYMRCCYLFMCIICALLIYKVLNNIMDKRISYLISLVVLTWAPSAYYGLYYDNFGNMFLLLGTLMILWGMYKKENSEKICNIFCVIAGILHACMCISYPTFTIIALFYFFVLVYKYYYDKKNKMVFFYVIGALCIIGILFMYVVVIDINNCFFMDKEILYALKGSRSKGILSVCIILMSSVINILQVKLIQSYIVLIFAALIIKYNNCSYWSRQLYGLLVILLAFFNASAAQPFFAYLSFSIPFMLILFDEKEFEKSKVFLVFLWIPSFLAYASFALTALYSAKAIKGCYIGGICCVILISMWLSNNDVKLKNNIYLKCILLVVVYFNLYWGYVNTYYSDKPLANSSHITKGIFKGIRVTESNKNLGNIEEKIKGLISEDDRSIYFGKNLEYGYLISDLIPATPNLWNYYEFNGNAYDQKAYNELILKYFNKVSGKPDIIVLNRKNYIEPKIDELIKNEYYIVDEFYDITVYRRNVSN